MLLCTPQGCIKNMAKSANYLLLLKEYWCRLIFWISHKVNSKDRLILAYCLPFGLQASPPATTRQVAFGYAQHVGKAGGLQILRCWGFESVFALRATPRQGKELRLHPQRPCWSEAEIPSPGTLKPSGFCNVGGNTDQSSEIKLSLPFIYPILHYLCIQFYTTGPS
jgi:hypothetical protein